MQNNSETVSELGGFLQPDKGEKFDDVPLSKELPAFDSDVEEVSDDVPLPPPELKAKHGHLKLEDIEDRYLEEQANEEEIGYAKAKLEGKKKNVFVNVNDYNKLMVTVRESRPNFKVFADKFQNLDNLSITLDCEIVKIKKSLEAIQRKLIVADNRLFEKVEDE